MKKEQKPRPKEGTEKRSKFPHWIWPLGLAATGLGAAAAVLLRGCWHTRMSWPTRVSERELDPDGEFSYQVCTQCGIKRLFDEKTFHPYGPYGYDLKELLLRERAARLRRMRRHAEAQGPASAATGTDTHGTKKIGARRK